MFFMCFVLSLNIDICVVFNICCGEERKNPSPYSALPLPIRDRLATIIEYNLTESSLSDSELIDNTNALVKIEIA